MNRFVRVWEESTGFAWLTDGLIQNTVQCGGSGSEPESRTVLCVEKKNDDPDRTPCGFFFLGGKQMCGCVTFGGAPAATHHVLGTQRGVTEVRGTQESRMWPTWARLSMHSDSVFCDG